MKKIITIVMICFLVGIIAVGCATDQDADRNNRGYSSPYTFDTNEDATRNNTGINEDNQDMNDYLGNMDNDTDRDINRPNNNYNGMINDDTRTGTDNNNESRIKSLLNKEEEVEDTSVAVNGDTCYVGLDVKDNNDLSEKQKEELSTSIKRLDPSINKVYFTTDENQINKLMDAVGDRTNANWNEIENIFR